jgi:Protein of unknown function (DUF3619)
MTSQIEAKDKELLQARLAVRLAALLGEQSCALPHDITERLRASREQAIARARMTRRHAESASASTVVALPGGLAVFGGPSAWWQRMANVLPLLVLVAGLLLIDQWTAREQVLAAADIDTVLLSDDLPPDAYADPGFAEFLKSPPP